MPRITRKTGEEFVDPTLRTTAFDAVPERIYRCDATGGSFEVQLPPAAGLGGLDICLYAEHDSGNAVIAKPDGADTVTGVASGVVNAREAAIFTSNNIDDWFKVS